MGVGATRVDVGDTGLRVAARVAVDDFVGVRVEAGGRGVLVALVLTVALVAVGIGVPV